MPPRPSHLLATSSTGRFCRLSHAAKCASAAVMPTRASTTNTTTAACPIAVSDDARIRPYSDSGALSSSPAVSISSTSRPRNVAGASLRSRVTPGSSDTSARRRPASRLNSVDLPTFGRPAIATIGRGPSLIYLYADRTPSSVSTSSAPPTAIGTWLAGARN